ncbi:MAG TPA: hypothetical protein DGC76_10335, partial [Candidatus Accumulibacter sp.]|nr:hypothetical protein [Accumulibacter sp.]
MRRAHRGVGIGNGVALDESLQFLDDVLEAVLFQPIFLRFQPSPRRRAGDGVPCSRQVVTDMVEIDEKVDLQSELLTHLIRNPCGAVADRMDLGLTPQSGLNRRAQQRLSDLVGRAHGGAEHRGDRARRMDQTQTRFPPAHPAGLAAVHFRALVVRFGRLHDGNNAPVDLADPLLYAVSLRDPRRRFPPLVDR